MHEDCGETLAVFKSFLWAQPKGFIQLHIQLFFFFWFVFLGDF